MATRAERAIGAGGPIARAVERTATLMNAYADVPMDLADATLVALAEERGLRSVFSLDSDFRIYRLHARQHFDVLPGWR